MSPVPVAGASQIINRILEGIGSTVQLLLRAASFAPTLPRQFGRLVEQCYLIGYTTLPIVAILSFFIGSVLALQAGDALPARVAQIVARELERDTAIRRAQNDAAEKLRGLTAKEQQAEQAMQQQQPMSQPPQRRAVPESELALAQPAPALAPSQGARPMSQQRRRTLASPCLTWRPPSALPITRVADDTMSSND